MKAAAIILVFLAIFASGSFAQGLKDNFIREMFYWRPIGQFYELLFSFFGTYTLFNFTLWYFFNLAVIPLSKLTI